MEIYRLRCIFSVDIIEFFEKKRKRKVLDLLEK